MVIAGADPRPTVFNSDEESTDILPGVPMIAHRWRGYPFRTASISRDPLMGGVAGSNLEKLELQLLGQGLSLGDSGAHTAASPANQQRKQDRPKPSVGISANKELRLPVPEPVVSGCVRLCRLDF